MVVLNYADVLNGIGFILGPKFGIAMQMQPKFATTLLEFSLSEYEIFFIGQCTHKLMRNPNCFFMGHFERLISSPYCNVDRNILKIDEKLIKIFFSLILFCN